jgi:hypothetical protein
MWISPNKHRVKVGDRIRLTNHLNEENLSAGLLGTVTHVNEGTHNLHIHMKWDNGSTLALLETDHDCYEIIKVEE